MTLPRIVFSHPTGNPFAKNAALAIQQSGFLREIVTSYVYDSNGLLGKLLRFLPRFLSDRFEREFLL